MVEDCASLKRWLDGFPSQQDGDPAAVCQTGELYVAVKVAMLARPGDEGVIEKQVAQEAQRQLNAYFQDRSGTIYWRERPEFAVQDCATVLRFDNNGPDVDFMTDRKCYTDKNWKKLVFYCRLYRATRLTMEKS